MLLPATLPRPNVGARTLAHFRELVTEIGGARLVTRLRLVSRDLAAVPRGARGLPSGGVEVRFRWEAARRAAGRRHSDLAPV
jgi:hypothetical protein